MKIILVVFQIWRLELSPYYNNSIYPAIGLLTSIHVYFILILFLFLGSPMNPFLIKSFRYQNHVSPYNIHLILVVISIYPYYFILILILSLHFSHVFPLIPILVKGFLDQNCASSYNINYNPCSFQYMDTSVYSAKWNTNSRALKIPILYCLIVIQIYCSFLYTG